MQIHVKFFFLIFLTTLFTLPTSCKTVEKETTTYYLIRHAEKDRSDASNRNPDLTEAGHERALRWANYFDGFDLDAIYATDYNRTQQTAAPTAQMKALDVQTYDPRNLYDAEFKSATSNKIVLIVGHSNTTPAFINAIVGVQTYEDMADNDNSTLFKVVIAEDATTVEILKVD